ncbi:hypothetical protein ARTSIC4J27_2121 [Pseudarthrobacter siccitolerans]|uniref:Alanine racemase n=1 Tax=Pseudarthrobacter siccitolerans TaxID=861266 RepID=A0A024H356_9MICC|nr:hypothetical protein [Pseudarthrobacter siccitolerans]CCQ46161.1 hypothetical protein ARTSIC4J27_2121 [Pseudarthrobacter siccitolerans]
MATAVQAKGLAVRPHVKTHKIPEIAQMQLAAGAVGLTLATLGEAEVFAEYGAQLERLRSGRKSIVAITAAA